jgi:hypothetical protein
MIISHANGNKKVFTANTKHPLFSEIHNILLKYIGFDKIIETVIERLGEVRVVFITGDFAQGRDSQIIDLVFIGDGIDRNYLSQLIEKAEKLIQRKIRFLIYASDEFNSVQWKTQYASALPLWTNIK